MGHSSSSDKNFLDQWTHLQKQGAPGSYTNLWVQKRNDKRVQMNQYPLHVSSEDQVHQQKQIFQMRRNHPHLVSSLYFVDETENQFCSSSYQGKIFIEGIPLTLQTVTDIPFPDALHVYSQSLQGFHILASEVVKGCFPISQEHIGINSESVCKVWMNNKFDKNFPSRNQRIHEHAMVRMILNTIQENVDHLSLQGKPSPFNYIYSSSRSPTEVRFDEAINLFRNYVREFFGGFIPEKLSCVQRVGGVSTLAKNWKNRYNDSKSAARNDQTIKSSQQLPGLNNANTFGASQPIMYRSNQNPQFQNNYTAFKRQEPIGRQISQSPISQNGIIYNQGANIQRAVSPSFTQNIQPQVNLIKSQVQAPIVVQQQTRTIPQVAYQNINQQQAIRNNLQQFVSQQPQTIRRSQVIVNAPTTVIQQRPVQNRPIPQGSIVNQLTTNTNVRPVNFINNAKTSEVRQSFIQNRVINGQINQPISIQQTNQSNIVQQQAPQPIIIRPQVPQPVLIQQNQPMRQIINIPPQQPVFINQQQSQVTGSIQNGVIRTSNITFQNSSQAPSTPQLTSTPYQATKTTSVYVTPQVVGKINETQRIQSQPGVVEKNSPIKQQNLNNEAFQSNQPNMRLRNNEESISSITAKTNQMPSNEQISDKFSIMKQEPIDNSTRNFYTNMINNQNSRTAVNNTNNNDYFSSYYANYTSKLYDNGNQTSKKVESPTKSYGIAGLNNQKSQAKYNVNINDGMSSLDFLNDLKTMKFSSNTFKKGEANIDYGLTSYEPTTFNKYSTGSVESEGYKFDYQNYGTTLTDGQNHQNDLYVVGKRVEAVPLENVNRGNEDNQNQYRMSYEYQQGQNPAGNIRYQTEYAKVEGENSGYEQQQYYESSNYQSAFDKYAAYDKYAQQSNNYGQNDVRLGQNLQTQYSRNNTDPNQYFEMTKNTINTTYNGLNPSQQMTEQQYQVQYDPQILADLQKLKGGN